MNAIDPVFKRMGGMLLRPARTARVLAADKSLKPAAGLVIFFGILNSLLFLASHLRRDYPPPPEVLEIWVEHWGEGVMLPFFNVPAESYRGFQAAIMLPFCLAIWMLMGGSARLAASLFGGRGSYETYLRITGFTFFSAWLIAASVDLLHSGLFQDAVLRGLQGEYGATVDFLLTIFMPLVYALLYGLAGANIAIAARAVEKFSWWKAALVGIAAFAWPMTLVSSVVR
jgi:hypothetical protein